MAIRPMFTFSLFPNAIDTAIPTINNTSTVEADITIPPYLVILITNIFS